MQSARYPRKKLSDDHWNDLFNFFRNAIRAVVAPIQSSVEEYVKSRMDVDESIKKIPWNQLKDIVWNRIKSLQKRSAETV